MKPIFNTGSPAVVARDAFASFGSTAAASEYVGWIDATELRFVHPAAAVGVVVGPHATATAATTNERTTSPPRARTICSPLCLAEGHAKSGQPDASITRRPLPNPHDRGESAPTTSAATWGGRTTTPVGNYTACNSAFKRRRVNRVASRCNRQPPPRATRPPGRPPGIRRWRQPGGWCPRRCRNRTCR